VREMFRPSRAQLRAMEAKNKTYPVDRLVEVPRAEWPDIEVSTPRVRVLRCRDFLVQEFHEKGVIRLTVQRCAFDERERTWKGGIGWDDLQHLKTLAGYGDGAAVELFPPDAEVVNIANMRHLWLLPEPPAWMWRSSHEGRDHD